MIAPTKRRLNFLFASVLIGFNMLILGAVFVYFHQSLLLAVKDHLAEEIDHELLPMFRAGNRQGIASLQESDHFQWFDRNGQVVLSTLNSAEFSMPLNAVLAAAAFQGRISHERVSHAGESYMVAYVPVDSEHIVRAAGPMELLSHYERLFGIGALISLPILFLLSLLSTRYLVNQAMKPIEAVSQYQETFSSNVTHELMSPLTSLRGNLEVALRRPRDVEEYQETLRLGVDEVDRVIDLLNNLGLLASSRFRPLDLYRERVDLRELVQQRLAHAEPRLAGKDVRVQVQADLPAWCTCDVSLMQRTVDNLIDNAAKYTPEGGSIDLRVGNYGAWTILEIGNSVADAPDLPPENLFEPFERGSETGGAIPGKGLGLYIARYIARSHGGELRINTASAERFALSLTLPATSPAADAV